MFGLTYVSRIILSVILMVLLNLTVLSYMLLYKENDQQVPSKTDVYHYVKYYFVRVLISNIVLWIGLVIAFILIFFPGFYFMPVALLIITIMVLENADLGYAFNRAFQLIKGHWWQTAGAILLNMLLIWSICMLFFIPVAMICGVITIFAGWAFASVFGFVAAISFFLLQFACALSPILMVLIYFNLHERHGNHHLLQRIEMLGKTQSSADHLQAEDY